MGVPQHLFEQNWPNGDPMIAAAVFGMASSQVAVTQITGANDHVAFRFHMKLGICGHRMLGLGSPPPRRRPPESDRHLRLALLVLVPVVSGSACALDIVRQGGRSRLAGSSGMFRLVWTDSSVFWVRRADWPVSRDTFGRRRPLQCLAAQFVHCAPVAALLPGDVVMVAHDLLAGKIGKTSTHRTPS